MAELSEVYTISVSESVTELVHSSPNLMDLVPTGAHAVMIARNLTYFERLRPIGCQANKLMTEMLHSARNRYPAPVTVSM